MRDGCPFCDYEGPSDVLARFLAGDVFVIEPINPVTPGHVLVIPLRHVPSFAPIAPMPTWFAVVDETMSAACEWARERVSGDVNLITSRGRAATQTVSHLHVHVIPRRKGDGLMLPWDDPND